MDTEILNTNDHVAEEYETGALNVQFDGGEECVYVFSYNKNTPYYNVVELAERYVAPGQIIDLGAGAGTLGRPLEEAGFRYTGLEMSRGGLKLMSERGIRNFYCDLTDLPRLGQLLEENGPVKALCVMDVLEHLEHPDRLLSFLSDYAHKNQLPYLIVSVPNVSHRDVAYKLLAGKWEMTETGILDKTHLRFFTRQALKKLVTENGWQIITENNFCLKQSDQYDSDSLLHNNDTLLGELVHYISDSFNPDNQVNQFIWLLKPQANAAKETITQDGLDKPVKRPLVSILVRTQGQRNDLLTEALYSIYAQECEDYELLICFHSPGADKESLFRSLRPQEREAEISNPHYVKDPQIEAFRKLYETVDKLPVELRRKTQVLICPDEGRSAPLNMLLEAGQGEYLNFLDDDDLLFPRHVEVVKKAVEKHGFNHMFQTYATERRIKVIEEPLVTPEYGFSRETPLEPKLPGATFPYTVELIRPTWIAPFNPLTQQYFNHVPITCFMLPRKLVEQTNLRFRSDFEFGEDWEFWMRASQFLKVVTLPEITAVINIRTNGTNTVGHDEFQPEWQIHHKKRLDLQSQHPLVLDGRTARLLYQEHLQGLIKQDLLSQQAQDSVRQSSQNYGKEYEELENWARDLNDRLQKITGSRLYRLIGRFLR